MDLLTLRLQGEKITDMELLHFAEEEMEAQGRNDVHMPHSWVWPRGRGVLIPWTTFSPFPSVAQLLNACFFSPYSNSLSISLPVFYFKSIANRQIGHMWSSCINVCTRVSDFKNSKLLHYGKCQVNLKVIPAIAFLKQVDEVNVRSTANLSLFGI